jgi:hypothetical protein
MATGSRGARLRGRRRSPSPGSPQRRVVRPHARQDGRAFRRRAPRTALDVPAADNPELTQSSTVDAVMERPVCEHPFAMTSQGHAYARFLRAPARATRGSRPCGLNVVLSGPPQRRAAQVGCIPGAAAGKHGYPTCGLRAVDRVAAYEGRLPVLAGVVDAPDASKRPSSLRLTLVMDGWGSFGQLPTLAYEADLRLGGRGLPQAVQYHRRWESGTAASSLASSTVTGPGRCSNQCSTPHVPQYFMPTWNPRSGRSAIRLPATIEGRRVQGRFNHPVVRRLRLERLGVGYLAGHVGAERREHGVAACRRQEHVPHGRVHGRPFVRASRHARGPRRTVHLPRGAATKRSVNESLGRRAGDVEIIDKRRPPFGGFRATGRRHVDDHSYARRRDALKLSQHDLASAEVVLADQSDHSDRVGEVAGGDA